MKMTVGMEVFKEGDVYVALSPELNISSFGDTDEGLWQCGRILQVTSIRNLLRQLSCHVSAST